MVKMSIVVNNRMTALILYFIWLQNTERIRRREENKLIMGYEKSKIDCIHIYRRDSHVSYCQEARSERNCDPDGS